MKIILLSIVYTLLTGCATTEAYEKVLNTYIGRPERAVIDGWGVPDSVYESGGTKYLTFRSSRSSYIPGTAPTYQTTCSFGYCTSTPIGGSPGFMLDRHCRTTFEIRGGTVASWRWDGNACRA